MKLKLIFGLGGPIKSHTWYGTIEDFPKVLELDGYRHSIANYRPDANKEFDYIIHFWRLGLVDPADGYIKNYGELTDLFSANGCQCGSAYDSSASSIHARWCNFYSKN